MKILILASLICFVVCQTPPSWPHHFHISFVESYNSTQTRVTGRYMYDYDKGFQRVDRHDGKFDMICNSIVPNITTPCTQLIRDSKRYIVFPERRTCCMCCDAAHGCGVLSPDWLKGSKFEGEETISGESFNKWSIVDGTFTDLYYSRKDEKNTPRRLVTGQAETDYMMFSYNEEEIPESVFALPSFCNSTCPPTTICGKFQGSLQQE